MKYFPSFRVAAALAALTSLVLPASAQTVTGEWQFNGDFVASVGTALTGVTGSWGFTSATIAGQTATVAQFSNGSYLSVPTGMGANGGGLKTNRYSIIMDVFFPSVSTPDFISLIQTGSTVNGNDGSWGSDGDWFIRGDGGMGISNDYTDAGNSLVFVRGAWQRIALVVDTTSPTGPSNVYRSYIDGVLQNTVENPVGWGSDLRFSLNPLFYLFGDDNGETSSGLINSLQVRDYAMSSVEVATLGSATAPGLLSAPEPGTVTLAVLGSGVLGLGIRRRRA